MKNLNKFWITGLVLLLFATLQVNAQEEEQTIKIKIQKEFNGEITTIEKTYKSIEEMKNDPDLKDMNIKMMGEGNFFFSSDEGGKVDIKIQKSKDGEHEGVHKNSFFFKVDGDKDVNWTEKSHNIEVIKDDNGKVTILKNGKPIEKDDSVIIHELNSSDIDDIEHIKVEKGDDGSRVIIINGDKELEWTSDEEVEIDENVEVIVNSFKEAEEGAENSESTITISIRKVKIHIEDIARKDEALKALNLDNKRELKLDGLSYYPNPTEGKFNLSFQGKSVPTEVRITNLTGKVVFSDVVSNFEGQYSNEIDLNDQAKGIYIMQVIQGNKAVNKKIIID